MDIEQLIEQLKKRYPAGSPYNKLDDLLAANEDLLPEFVQLRMKSNDLFHMPAEMYLKTQGILTSRNGNTQSATDPREQQRNRMLSRVLGQLEAYYPEHRVFSLDSIDSGLRERVNTLSRGMGYESVDKFLLDHGYEMISGEEVRNIRNMVIYFPGNEPEVIRSNVRSMLSRLEEYYPDHVIPRSIQADHKKLSQNVSGLYQWLGYENAGAMLKAYGYEYIPGGPGNSAGRPTNDYQPVIDTLTEKYRNGRKPRTITELVAENPEYAGAIKTLQNSASERFGMSLGKYFTRIGVIEYRYEAESIPTGNMPETQEIVSESNWRIDKRRATVEDRRKKLEDLTAELSKRYPAGTTLPTTLWELRRDNKDLPLSSAESWTKIVFSTTLAIYLRERHLLGDNAIASGHSAGRESAQSVLSGIGAAASQNQRTRELADRERLDGIIAELKKRYPNMASEGSLAELKRVNPDLNIGSLTGLIKRVSGLSPTAYFKKLRLVVSVSLYDIGFDYDTIWPLNNAGIQYVGQLLKLSQEDIDKLPNAGTLQRIRIQNIINRCRVLYDVDIADLGLSKHVLSVLQSDGVSSALEVAGGGLRYNGIGPVSSDEINRCIMDYVLGSYRKVFGYVRLEELGISKRVMNVLSRHGIVYAYEAVDGCIDYDGIGQASALEILNALNEYVKSHPSAETETTETETEETIIEEMEPIVPAIDPEVSAAEELARKKAEAEKSLQTFIEKLKERYPDGEPKETLMIHLRRANPDMPFMDAFGWCKLLYDKQLKDYLEEVGILASEKIEPDSDHVSEQSQVVQKVDGVTDVPTSGTGGTVRCESGELQLHTYLHPTAPQIQETETVVEPEDNFPIKGFSDEYIEACVQRDTKEFKRYILENNLRYTMAETYGYIRKLHMLECSSYMKKEKSVSYAEYLTIHGLIPEKPKTYWKEEFWGYLKENYLECSGGMLVSDQPSFEYDSIRGLCRISTPFYDGYNRITGIQMAEKYSGKLELQPCYCEQNYACDVALTSGGKIVGQLSRTLFRMQGLGSYLSTVFYSGAAVTRNVSISSGELPQVILELQFK